MFGIFYTQKTKSLVHETVSFKYVGYTAGYLISSTSIFP